MDILKPLVRHITSPLYSWKSGYSYGRHLEYLDKSQWFSREQIVEMQQTKLVELVRYAYKSNSFYQARMKSIGLIPSDIKTSADLRDIPILTKDQIRKVGKGLFSDEYSEGNTLHTRTGGSTGVPLHIYVDKEAMNWKYAATWRHNGWAGWRPGDKVAAVWGDTDKAFSWKSWLRFHLQHRMIFLETLSFTDERLRDFHSQILDYRPTVMMGHAHSVYQFARFCNEHDLRIPRMSGVITTAMTLSEKERNGIEDAFGTPVFNRYGCEELSIIASESDAHSGLHVFSEGLILEYLPTEIDGEYELIVTDLLNRAMPLIRYSIGDLAQPTKSECPSGRNLERLNRVSGRTADFLYRPDGTPVFGISILDTHIIHIDSIKQAQIVQNKLTELTVNVVPEPSYSPRDEKRLRDILHEQFGASVRLDIVLMDALPQTERGKYRFSICNIDRPSGLAQLQQ